MVRGRHRRRHAAAWRNEHHPGGDDRRARAASRARARRAVAAHAARFAGRQHAGADLAGAPARAPREFSRRAGDGTELAHDLRRPAPSGWRSPARICACCRSATRIRASMTALAVMLDCFERPELGAELMARFELMLLDELGVGLDLDACAATGSRDDLAYVSPKSGRAVSRAAGLPYRGAAARAARLPHRAARDRRPDGRRSSRRSASPATFLSGTSTNRAGRRLPEVARELHQGDTGRC